MLIGPQRPTDIIKNQADVNLSREELLQRARKAEQRLNKMSRDRQLPTAFIQMRKQDVISKPEMKQEQILGFKILMRRKGDSYSVFSIIEKAKKKWLWWNEEEFRDINQPALTQDNIKSSRQSQRTLSRIREAGLTEKLKVVLDRWILAIQWSSEMREFLRSNQFSESIELFDQAFSLELAEFSVMFWNRNYEKLSQAQIILFHDFINRQINSPKLQTVGKEPRLDAMQQSLAYTVESVFLNQFTTFLLRTLEDFWNVQNYELQGKLIVNLSF